MYSATLDKKSKDRDNLDRQNCLSLVKLLAAFQVMFGHIRTHLNLPIPAMVASIIDYFQGVPIFFIISGLLIWQSIARSNTYHGYIKKRFWRIYPELWVCVVVEISSIIIFYKGWKLRDLILFAVTQGTFFQFWTPDSLRGYGCGTPNGTLWTMCVTIQFYLISWFLYKALHKKRIKTWILVLIGSVCLSVAGRLILKSLHIGIITKLYGQTIIRYLWLFLIGCFISEFKTELLPLLKKFWFVLIVLGLIPYLCDIDINAGYNVFKCILMVSGLLGFAFRYPKLDLKRDISYPVFLYHMIVVNVFITLGYQGQWIYGVMVMIISCIIAYISTVTIGRWSQMKSRTIRNE